MIDINVFIPGNLPVHEAVTENEDGSYSIFISDNLSPAARHDAYLHALKHIYRNDLQSGSPVQDIETQCHL